MVAAVQLQIRAQPIEAKLKMHGMRRVHVSYLVGAAQVVHERLQTAIRSESRACG